MSLTEPAFDPKNQHALLGALGALEVFAGAVLSLPFLASSALAVAWLVDVLRGRHHRWHLHHVSWEHVLMLGASTVLATALLWAGVALLRGRPYRYRAQGALLVAVMAVVGLCVVARELERVLAVAV